MFITRVISNTKSNVHVGIYSLPRGETYAVIHRKLMREIPTPTVTLYRRNNRNIYATIVDVVLARCIEPSS